MLRNQYLGARYAHRYWGIITSRPSKWTNLGSTCVYTHVPMHMHLYMLLHPPTAPMYIKNQFTLTPPTPVQLRRVDASFPIFRICTAFSSGKKPSS